MAKKLQLVWKKCKDSKIKNNVWESFVWRRPQFSADRSAYSTHYSIGWRDGYERGRSVCYCKDLIGGEIGKLYEY